jgi:hypothetical protein
MAAANPIEESYLKRILASVAVNDFSAPFRTDFDNWFAFKEGGAFLNANSRPHWHNNPCPDKHGAALRRAHFVSHAAARTLGGVTRERLMKDHAIPVSVLRDMLFEEQPRSTEEVRAFMLRYYCFGIITEEEDAELNRAGLRSRMPDGWTPNDSPFARYEKVGIVAQDRGSERPAPALAAACEQDSKRFSSFGRLLSSISSKPHPTSIPRA